MKCQKCGVENDESVVLCSMCSASFKADETQIHREHLAPPLKNSGIGIASFIISLAIGALDFALLCVAILQTTIPGYIDEKSPIPIILGLLLIGGFVISLVGLVLGIIGVIQRDRKKLFAILGLVFNGMIVLGMAAVMVIGSMISKNAS